MARRSSTSLSLASPPNRFKSRQSVSSLNLDSSTRNQNDILFDTLMSDPAKRAVILEMLTKEKNSIEKYKRREEQKKLIEQKRLKRMQRLLHFESPTALYRRKVLEKARRDSNSSSNSECLPQDTRCIRPMKVAFNCLLKDVTAYVEVCCNGNDRSGGIKKLMTAMGASVREQFTPDVTHVVYKDGTYQTYNKAKLWKVNLVSVLWLEATRTNGYKMPEKNYPALGTDLFDANVSQICEDYTNIVNEEIRKSQLLSFLNKRDKTKGRRAALPMELEAIQSELPQPYTRLSEVVVQTSQDWEAVSVISYGSISDDNHPPSVVGSDRLGSSPRITSEDDSDCGVINGESSKRDSVFSNLDMTGIEKFTTEFPSSTGLVKQTETNTSTRKSKRGSLVQLQFTTSSERRLRSSDETPSLNKNSASSKNENSSLDSEPMPPLRLSSTSNETSEKNKKHSAASSADSEEMPPLRISSENDSNSRSLRRSSRFSKTTSLEEVRPELTDDHKLDKSGKMLQTNSSTSIEDDLRKSEKKIRSSLRDLTSGATEKTNSRTSDENSGKKGRNSLAETTKITSTTTGENKVEKSRNKMEKTKSRTSDEDDFENSGKKTGSSLTKTEKVNFSIDENKVAKSRKNMEKSSRNSDKGALETAGEKTGSSSAEIENVISSTTDENIPETPGKKTTDNFSDETEELSTSDMANEENRKNKTKRKSKLVNSAPSKKTKGNTGDLDNSNNNKNNGQLSYPENTHRRQLDKLISNDENVLDYENEDKMEKKTRRKSQWILKEQNTDANKSENSTNLIEENIQDIEATKTNKLRSCETTPVNNQDRSISNARKCNTEVSKHLKKLYNVNQSLDDLFRNFDWEQEESAKATEAKTSKKVTVAPLCVTQSVKKLIEERSKKERSKKKKKSPRLARIALDVESSKRNNISKNGILKVHEKLGKTERIRKNKNKKEDTPKLNKLDGSSDEQKELADELLNKQSRKDEIIRPETNRRSTFEFVQEKIQNTQKKTQNRRKKKTSIVCTRLHRSEVQTFTQTVTKLGGYFVEDEVSSKTSHLVAGEAKRTINLLRALARGCWILKHEWLLQSLEAGHWLPEEEYELIEFSPAIEQCRKERQAFGSLYSMDIFENCGPIFISYKSVPQTSNLQELVKLCKGTIVKDIQKAKLVVGEFTRLDDVTCVTEHWVMDSITYNKKKAFRHYILKQ